MRSESSGNVHAAKPGPEEFGAEPVSGVRNTPQNIRSQDARGRDTFLSQIPIVSLSTEALVRLPINHRVGFLLSLLDGRTTVQTVIDISGMTPDYVLTILDGLIAMGVISLR